MSGEPQPLEPLPGTRGGPRTPATAGRTAHHARDTRTDGPLDVPRWELVVCDLIGTLVLDHGCIHASIDAALEHAAPGQPASRERVRSLRGANKGEMFEALAPGAGAEALAVFNEHVRAHLQAGAFEPLPGSAAALAGLRAEGASICLTSGLGGPIVAAMVQRFGWSDSIDDVLTCEDVARGRPYPDLVLTAALSAEVGALDRVVVCGDTANDLWAGHNASAGLCVGVLTGAHDRARLTSAPHDHIVASIAELPAILASTNPTSTHLRSRSPRPRRSTMPVYVVVQFTVHDPEPFEHYAVTSRATIREHGGRVIARGTGRPLHGEPPHEAGAILEFPSEDEARAWFDSDDYQGLAPIRDGSSEQIFALYPSFEDKPS